MEFVALSPLEQAVVDNPEDRETHLVYADWLEERGDEAHHFHRLLGTSARMTMGYSARPVRSCLTALLSARAATISIGPDAEQRFACVDATLPLFQFAHWCAREALAITDEEPHPDLLAALNHNELWLEGSRSSRHPVRDAWRSIEGVANAVCRMACYSVALSAAKYCAHYGMRTGAERLSRGVQSLVFSRMLFSYEDWRLLDERNVRDFMCGRTKVSPSARRKRWFWPFG